MINLFEIASRDQSVIYLANIFGSMNGVIPGSGSGVSITLLGTMFKTFNSVVLAVAALIIVYTTVVGVMMTAHEGEFMKKWNSLWTPIRMVLGIAVLVPTPSGFSGLQIIMMWIIVQGIGAADTLWTSALAYIDVAGSPYAQVTIPGGDAEDMMTGIFKGLVCQESAIVFNGAKRGKIKAFDPGSDATTYQFGPKNNGDCGVLSYCSLKESCKQATPNNDGTLPDNNLNPDESIACEACKAQRTALDNIFQLLTGVASNYVAKDKEFLEFTQLSTEDQKKQGAPDFLQAYCADKGLDCVMYVASVPSINLFGVKLPEVPKAGTENGISLKPGEKGPKKDTTAQLYWAYVVSPNVAGSDFIGTAVDYYINGITDSVNKIIENRMNNPQQMKTQLREAQSTGWLFAGGYYAALAKQQSNNFENAIPTLNFSEDCIGATIFSNPTCGSPDNRNNFQAAGWLVSLAEGDDIMGTLSAGGALKKTSTLTKKAFKSIKAVVGRNIKQGSVNPLMQLQIAGTVMLYAAQTLYVATATFWATTTTAVGAIPTLYAGTGYAINPANWGLAILFVVFMPLVIALEGFLITFGGMLAVYLPLVPYIIFMFGVIGWFMSVMEAMVAGPLIALGIIAPSQHGHELLGKADKALMMIFQIFLRPSLMIFGFFIAMLLASVLVDMINISFWVVVARNLDMAATANVTQGGNTAAAAFSFATNPLMFAMFLAAYIMLVVTVVNKCFAAIHIIPDKVLHWIGHHGGEHGAPDQDVGAVKGGVSGAASKAQSGMKGVEKGIGTRTPKGDSSANVNSDKGT